MNVLMISGDKGITKKQTAVRERMKTYAHLFNELHIVVPSDGEGEPEHVGNLFMYPAYGKGKIMQRIRMFRYARLVARKHRIDVVTSQSPDEFGLIAFLVARLSGSALQLQVHTDIMSKWYRRAGIISYIKFLLARFLLHHADCLRVVSVRIKQSLEDQLGINASKISVLPIFTDTGVFLSAIPDEYVKKRFSRYGFKMMAVGRFVDREKNFSMLIDVMADFVKTYSDAVLVLVGEGPDKEMYRRRIRERGLENHVIIEPWQNNLAGWYGAFDLFLLPSYIEGWGIAVIEAMSAGCAVIMTDVGLAREVVHDGINGRIVPVADPRQFLNAMIDLYEHPEKRAQFVRAAHESIQRIAQMTEKDYLAAFRKCFETCVPRG